MDRNQGLLLAERLGEPNLGLRPSMGFMQELHDEFNVELTALRGRSALARPYGGQQLTIAEQFYEDELQRFTLYTADLMEVNRTVMNVFIKNTLLHPDEIRGSYDVITNCQKNPATILQHPTHRWLRGFTREVLFDPQREKTMDNGLICADMGKSNDAITYMYKRRGKVYADHDRLLVDLFEDSLAASRWTPAFLRLPASEQELLIRIYRSDYHMPQDMLGESLPSKWVRFHELSKEDQHFALLLGLLDISGAQGDRIQNGSPTLIEPVVTSFRALVEAHDTPAEGLSPQEAALYRNGLYLQYRGNQLGLSLEQPHGRALIRLCCSMYYSSPAQAELLQDVIQNDMQPQDRNDLLELMGYTGFEPEGHAWIMYLPALLTRYREKLEDKGVPPRKALDAALTLAARTYAAAKEQISLRSGVVIVAGDLVRAFEEDPRIPLTHNIRIRPISPTESKAEFELAA